MTLSIVKTTIRISSNDERKLSENWWTATLTNGKDSDEIPHNVTFYQGLHFFLRSKQFPGAEKQGF